jgi:VWFA-related protein
VAYLVDGNATEDLVFINAPKEMANLRINMVELFTSVSDKKGLPIEGLSPTDFVIREEGQEQELRRFELVQDLSVHAGVILDASTSMREELDQAVEGALQFFEAVLQPKDRAAVLVFNDEPILKVPFTNRLETLSEGLENVESEGETALYDTLVYALHYFAGIRGKRALVLLSDGADSRSRYTFAETLEFAQRSGVAIYSIGLGVDRRQLEARNVLQRLARETGGRFFSITSARELQGIYTRIEQELRSQYLLAYQSTHEEGGDFRRVEVEIGPQGLKAKTIPGYYP